MSSVLIIFIGLVLSVSYRYNTIGTETVWWETHIPTFTFIVLSLYLLLSQKFRHQVIHEFAMSMATISIVGVVSVFLASRYNTSIYAMGITLSIPAVTYFADTNKKWLLTIIVLVYLTCFVAVSLAGSRTGIIAMLLSAIYLSYRILHFNKYILSDIEILGVDSFDDSSISIMTRIKTKPSMQWIVGRDFNKILTYKTKPYLRLNTL